MNPLSQGYKIRVEGAYNDAFVRLAAVVKADEMSPIECEENAPLFGRISQHFRVGQCLIRAAGLLDGQDIVTQPSKLKHGRQGEILVAIERGQG